MVPPTSPAAPLELKEDESHDEQQVPNQSQSILRNKVILSILVTETAERVAYFGFRAVLVLYFTNGLEFSESTSVSLFASVSGLAYLSPLVGALLADSSWGRYQTILRFGTLYSIGMCLITLGAYQLGPTEADMNDYGNANSELRKNILVARSLSFVGLIFVCLGTGGIKPCVSAFGADQVVLSDAHNIQQTPETTKMEKKHSDDGDENLSDHFLEDNDSKIYKKTTSTLEISTTSHGAKDDHVREFFNSFYFCINVGALLSFAIIPIVRAKHGFGAAFLIPSIFMVGALCIFLSQRKAYKHRRRDLSQPSLSTTLYFCWDILLSKTSGRYSQINSSNENNTTELSVTANHRPHAREEEQPGPMRIQDGGIHDIELDTDNHRVRQDAEKVLHLMPLMLFFPVFWMLYDQQGSVWTLQATRLNLYGLEPEQLQFLNPLEIMIFIPLFDRVFYPWLEAKGFNIQPLKRMEYGMFLGAVAFFASAILEYSMGQMPSNSISVTWQIPQITILTVAEILLNVTGLEFAYSQAPDSLQALILAVFLFMTAIGDGFGSILFATIFRDLNTVVIMVTCATAMLVNLFFFSRAARQWKPYQARSEIIYNQSDQRGDGESEEGLQLSVLANHGVIS